MTIESEDDPSCDLAEEYLHDVESEETPQVKCKWCGKLIDQGEVLCSMCSEAGQP